MLRQTKKTPRHLIPIRVRFAGKSLMIRPVAIHEPGHMLVAMEHGYEIDHAVIQQPHDIRRSVDIDIDMQRRGCIGYVRRKPKRKKDDGYFIRKGSFECLDPRVLERVEIKVAGRIALEVVTGNKKLAKQGSRADYRRARKAIDQHNLMRFGMSGSMLVTKLLRAREEAIRSLLSKRLDDLLRLSAELDARQLLDGRSAAKISSFAMAWQPPQPVRSARRRRASTFSVTGIYSSRINFGALIV